MIETVSSRRLLSWHQLPWCGIPWPQSLYIHYPDIFESHLDDQRSEERPGRDFPRKSEIHPDSARDFSLQIFESGPITILSSLCPASACLPEIFFVPSNTNASLPSKPSSFDRAQPGKARDERPQPPRLPAVYNETNHQVAKTFDNQRLQAF